MISIGSDNGLEADRRQTITEQMTTQLTNTYASFGLDGLYSETTWAVGIVQLTHHEVQGGGKNPETEGRGIFAPTADTLFG